MAPPTKARSGGGLERLAALIATVALVGSAWTARRRSTDPSPTKPDRATPVRGRQEPSDRADADADDTLSEASRGGVLGRVDCFQQSHRPLAFVVGVIRKFGDDRAGRLAALIAYYGFFSLFPLLLAATTILGFVAGDSSASSLQDSALAQLPVVGDQISGATQPLTGSVVALVIGVALALWAGLSCMQAGQDAMNEVWAVPRVAQPGFVPKRARSLASLLVIGVSLAASTFATQSITLLPDLPGLARVGGVILSIVLNALVFLVMFQVLASGRQGWRKLVPGSAVGGVGYTVLQGVGQWYVGRSVSGATDTYGTFAIVIGLISWLYLLSQFTLFAAEVNVVHARRLWPRSLFPPKLTAADKRAMTDIVRAQQARPEQQIEVSYELDEPDPPAERQLT